jgi:peptidoglycan/LPS O-acetylase OafA/YrhL
LALTALGGIGVVVTSAQLGFLRAIHLWPVLDLLVGLTAAAFLVYLVHSPASLPRRILCFKPLVAVGIFSYSIYLVHAPIIQGLWLLSTKVLHLSFFPSLGIMLGIGLPAIVGFAYAFHLVFEKPFLHLPDKPQTAFSPAP